ncbi:MAG: hypothetical protein HQL54_11410 [Magnetococcales bacterium]|nr:hypothetical protein [Magnetococcales bacterium]
MAITQLQWNSRHRLGGLIMALACFILPAIGRAESDTPMKNPVEWINQLSDKFKLHGFLSQGFTYSNGNNYYGDSTHGSFDLTEIGLNLSYRLRPDTTLAVQGLSRRAGGMDNGSPRLDYAFVDHTVAQDSQHRWGVRLGRIKNPIGFYNESRDIAVVRPGIILPQSIYLGGMGLRDFFLASDGLGLYWQRHGQDSALSVDYQVALPTQLSSQTQRAFMRGVILPGHLDMETGQVLRILHDNETNFRWAVTGVFVKSQYKPAAVDLLTDGTVSIYVLTLSADWLLHPWQLTSEAAWRELVYKGFGAAVDSQPSHLSIYGEALYRWSEDKWQASLRYDLHYFDIDDPNGSTMEAHTGVPGHSRFSKDLTLGLGWNVTPTFQLRAEYHLIDGSGFAPLVDNPGLQAGNVDRYWDILTLQAAFRF